MTETAAISINLHTEALEPKPKGRHRAEPAPHTPIFEEIVHDRAFRPATRFVTYEIKEGKHVADAN